MSAAVHDSQALVNRLHRIGGQVRGLERMLDEVRYCIDVLTQVAAVRTALDRFALQLLTRHVDTCVAEALASDDPDAAEQKRRELLAALDRFTRTQ